MIMYQINIKSRELVIKYPLEVSLGKLSDA